MNEKIRIYIDELFLGAPKTKRALELKEEMISNAQEKFADLLKEGYREEDAYAVVIHSIGNVDELFRELEQEDGDAYSYRMMELELRQKKAKLTAVSVGLYVFAAAVFFAFALLDGAIYFSTVDLSLLGLVLAVLICIAPTVMLVYAANILPHTDRREEDAVEGHKEWKADDKDRKEIRKAISHIIWTITLVLYFLISFSTMDWYITWVIFLIGGCVESIVKLLFSLKK